MTQRLPPELPEMSPLDKRGEPNSQMWSRKFTLFPCNMPGNGGLMHVVAVSVGWREGSENLLYGMTGLSILQPWSQVKGRTTGSTQC